MDVKDINNTWAATGEPVTPSDVLDYEENLLKTAVEKFDEKEGKKDASVTKSAHQLRQRWIHVVQAEIDRILDIERAKAKGVTKKQFFKQLSKVPTHKLADAAISVVFDGTQHDWSERMIEENIGLMVGTLVFQAIMDYNANSRRRLERLEIRVSEIKGKDSIGRAESLLNFANKYGFESAQWVGGENNNKRYRAIHGAPLAAIVLKMLPDLFERYKDRKDHDSNLTKYVQLTEVANDDLAKIRVEALNLLTSHRGPMIMPPRDWGIDNIGPYARQSKGWQVPLVRHAGKEQQKEVDERKRDGRLSLVLEALNAIQKTPYSVNQYVLSAVEWVHSHLDTDNMNENLIGREIGGFPNTKRLKLEESEKIHPDEFKELPKKEQIRLARKASSKKRHNQRAEGAVELCDRMISKAQSVSKFTRFWLPHNLDYRGRVYHIPDFGHHNTDLVRAMFQLENAKEVDEYSEQFIKLMLANHAGKDKDANSVGQTIEERLQWVDDNEASIIAAGTDFKTTYAFWGGQDKSSFQFLAACRDWASYQQAKQAGVPYKSGLPIAFDATQSGVQHFAGAGLNLEEGRKVNLTVTERPADFYTLCLNRAIGSIDTDLRKQRELLEANPLNDKDRQNIENHELELIVLERKQYPDIESEIDQNKEREGEIKRAKAAFKRTAAYKKQNRIKDIEAAEVALKLYEKGEYTRSEIKRNAMVFCYSSKEYGMSQQLFDDWMVPLATKAYDGGNELHPFGDDDGFHAARYLATHHYNAISMEVTSAKYGMEFMQNLAGIMSASDVKHFKFVNRLHFPMFQNYRKGSSKAQKVFGLNPTQEYDREVQSYYTRFTEEVDIRQSASAVAPNVIHQQDSLHLMMTVLSCLDNGVTDFMVVHDSFATVAADAEKLNDCIREQFIDLYKDYNLYEDLLTQCKERHPDPTSVQWPEPPKQGDLDITEVWDSEFFFS